MAKLELEKRVENIEETLKILNTLPERVGGLEARVGGLETQFLQFRLETRAEFSAVRQEMAGMKAELKADIAAVRVELHDVRDDVKTHAKILHEDLIERIKTLREH